jgi:hypothetical protein
MSYVLVYEGQELGGPSREEFVEAVRAEGAPLSADRYSQINYTYGMLHQAPLFTKPDVRLNLGSRHALGERPVRVNTCLPISEYIAKQLVSFPRLDKASPHFVRLCGRALRKVMTALVPQSTQALPLNAAPHAENMDSARRLRTMLAQR